MSCSSRLRGFVCPASAAAFMLAVATDADADGLNSWLCHFVEPDASQLRARR